MDIINIKFQSWGISIDGDLLGMYASYKGIGLTVAVIVIVRVVRKFRNK